MEDAFKVFGKIVCFKLYFMFILTRIKSKQYISHEKFRMAVVNYTWFVIKYDFMQKNKYATAN